MSEAGSVEEYRAVQAELMRAKTAFIRAQTALAKAETAKIKAETLERHGISADEQDNESEDDDHELATLEKRNARVYAQLEREEAKLAKLEGRKPVRRLVRRHRT